MVVRLYSIYDMKTRVFSPPMLYHNDAHAMRDLSRELEKEQSMVAKFPHDFEIRSVGSWNDSTGEIEQTEIPVVVCRFSDLVEQLKKE